MSCALSAAGLQQRRRPWCRGSRRGSRGRARPCDEPRREVVEREHAHDGPRDGRQHARQRRPALAHRVTRSHGSTGPPTTIETMAIGESQRVERNGPCVDGGRPRSQSASSPHQRGWRAAEDARGELDGAHRRQRDEEAHDGEVVRAEERLQKAEGEGRVERARERTPGRTSRTRSAGGRRGR